MNTRREFLQSAGIALAVLSTRPALFALEDQQYADQSLLEEFHYGDVTLAPGRAETQFDQTQSVLMGMNEDSLLNPWRLRAGLPGPGPDMGGWYDIQGFAPAHRFGQWISALARGYAVNGDASKSHSAATEPSGLPYGFRKAAACSIHKIGRGQIQRLSQARVKPGAGAPHLAFEMWEGCFGQTVYAATPVM